MKVESTVLESAQRNHHSYGLRAQGRHSHDVQATTHDDDFPLMLFICLAMDHHSSFRCVNPPATCCHGRGTAS